MKFEPNTTYFRRKSAGKPLKGSRFSSREALLGRVQAHDLHGVVHGGHELRAAAHGWQVVHRHRLLHTAPVLHHDGEHPHHDGQGAQHHLEAVKKACGS